jgi:tetratricopeptide (TPR) repeat protein
VKRKKIFYLLLTVHYLLFIPSVFAQDTDELLKEATRFFNTGNYQQSLRIYEKILKAGVSSASIYNNIGVIYVKLFEKSNDENYLKKAISFFTLATVIDPEYEIAERNLNEVIDSYIDSRVKEEVERREEKEGVKGVEGKEGIEGIEGEKEEEGKEGIEGVEGKVYQLIGREEVIEFLERWKALWESKNPEYFRLYSPEGCMDFERFVRYKKRIWRKSKDIKVKIEDLHIRRNADNSVCVTFRQLYSSSVMKSKARKALCLRKKNGEIKIYCEWFIPTVRIE